MIRYGGKVSSRDDTSFVFLVRTLSVILYVLPLVKLNTEDDKKDLSPKEIEDRLKEEFIIPDVIYTVPKNRMEARFEEEGHVFDVNYGTFLTPRQTRNEPKVKWPVEKDARYTLLCVCPDVPDREEPRLRDWVQWLNVNIHGCNVSTGNNVNHWQGPGPNAASGIHRYVFLVFKQNPDFDIHLNRSDSSKQMRTWTRRMEFSTDDFIKQFNLGDPWASNYFMSRFNNFQ